MYGHNDWRDYLAHYGVPGMTWNKHKYLAIVNGAYKYAGVSGPTAGGTLYVPPTKSNSKKKTKKSKKDEDLLELEEAKEDKKKDDLKLKNEDESLLSSKKDKDLDSVANEVIRGKYDVGEKRRKTIEKLGMSYAIVQNRVNEILGSKFRHKVTDADKKKMADYKTKSSSKKKKKK